MGQCQRGGVDAQAVDGNEVDVDGAVAIAASRGPVRRSAAHQALYPEQSLQQDLGLAGGHSVEHHADVEKAGLRLKAPRLRLYRVGAHQPGLGPL